MGVCVVVGANWGDEGKGKMIDFLAERADAVVRFQGGANAGHTVINKYGKNVLHLLPSGVFYPDVLNILGPGVAVDIQKFLEELHTLEKRGVPAPKVLISERAQVLLPYHKLLDVYEEERLGARQFGSTKSGIAPFYSDKYAKVGIQISDLLDPEILLAKLESVLEIKNVLIRNLYGKPELKPDNIIGEISGFIDEIRPYVCDTTLILNRYVKEGKEILMEGQLGALRDPDYGIYPFSTSSSTLAGYATVGGGIPPCSIERVIAVVKAYSSAVGAGPFVVELFGKDGDKLRERGGSDGEYGATTGRPRRVGWFDAVATRYGCMVQGATEIALTLLDVLGYLDEIPVCTEYELNGERLKEFPVTSKLKDAKPVYRMLPGWKCDISGARSLEDLPVNARRYISYIEETIGLPIRWISVGPRREQTIII